MILKDGVRVTMNKAKKKGWIGKNRITLDGVEYDQVFECLTGTDGWIEHYEVERKEGGLYILSKDENGEVATVRKHGNVTFEVTA